jgi:dihydrofolate reductase
VRNWIQRGLVDDVILMVCPVLVGAGKRFFENGTTTTADIAPGERDLASTTSEILDRRALEWSRLCMAGSIPDAA